MKSTPHFSVNIHKGLLIKSAFIGLVIIIGALVYLLVQTHRELSAELNTSQQLASDKQGIQDQLRGAQACIVLFESVQDNLIDYGDNMDAASQFMSNAIVNAGNSDWAAAVYNAKMGKEKYLAADNLLPSITAAFALIEVGNCSENQQPGQVS